MRILTMTGADRQTEKNVYDLVRTSADYPVWNGPPERTIVICTQQRSGSTLLGEAIYFAGGLGCPLEYFHKGFRPGFARRWSTDDICSYVAAVYRHRTDPSGVFSVKLFWQDVLPLVRELAPDKAATWPEAGATHVADAAYRQVLDVIAPLFPQPTFIFLRREDELRQAISLVVATQTKRWRQMFNPANVKKAITPTFDFEHIVQSLANIQNANAHWRNFFRANALKPKEIRYEDLDKKYRPTIQTLLGSLGHPDARIESPRLNRQATTLSETLYRQFLSEFRNRTNTEQDCEYYL